MKRTPDLIRAELLSFIRTAGLWHFDDGMADQLEASTGERSFSAWEVLTVTQLLDEAFAVLGEDEVWQLGMTELEAWEEAPAGRCDGCGRYGRLSIVTDPMPARLLCEICA